MKWADVLTTDGKSNAQMDERISKGRDGRAPGPRTFCGIAFFTWDKVVIQCFLVLVGYRGTCHLSLVFSSYTH